MMQKYKIFDIAVLFLKKIGVSEKNTPIVN